MDLEEYLKLSGNPAFRRTERALGEKKLELAQFESFLGQKVIEQQFEGFLEYGGISDEGFEHVYLKGLYLLSDAFPCQVSFLRALQGLKKKVRLTQKLEILDEPEEAKNGEKQDKG